MIHSSVPEREAAKGQVQFSCQLPAVQEGWLFARMSTPAEGEVDQVLGGNAGFLRQNPDGQRVAHPTGL